MSAFWVGRHGGQALAVIAGPPGARFSLRDTRRNMGNGFEYIKVFYNRKRMHSTWGKRSPCQMLNA